MCMPQGGGIYISGGTVAIETSQIFSNTAYDVRYAPVSNHGRYVTVHRPVDVTDMCVSFCIWQFVSTRAGFEQRAHHNAPLKLPCLVTTHPVDVTMSCASGRRDFHQWRKRGYRDQPDLLQHCLIRVSRAVSNHDRYVTFHCPTGGS